MNRHALGSTYYYVLSTLLVTALSVCHACFVVLCVAYWYDSNRQRRAEGGWVNHGNKWTLFPPNTIHLIFFLFFISIPQFSVDHQPDSVTSPRCRRPGHQQKIPVTHSASVQRILHLGIHPNSSIVQQTGHDHGFNCPGPDSRSQGPQRTAEPAFVGSCSKRLTQPGERYLPVHTIITSSIINRHQRYEDKQAKK